MGWLRTTVLLAPAPAWATLLGWSPMTLDRHHGFLSTHSPAPAFPRPALPGSCSFLANHRHCLPVPRSGRQQLPWRCGGQQRPEMSASALPRLTLAPRLRREECCVHPVAELVSHGACHLFHSCRFIRLHRTEACPKPVLNRSTRSFP